MAKRGGAIRACPLDGRPRRGHIEVICSKSCRAGGTYIYAAGIERAHSPLPPIRACARATGGSARCGRSSARASMGRSSEGGEDAGGICPGNLAGIDAGSTAATCRRLDLAAVEVALDTGPTGNACEAAARAASRAVARWLRPRASDADRREGIGDRRTAALDCCPRPPAIGQVGTALRFSSRPPRTDSARA